MKWYFASNENGSRGDYALHARLAVLSARENTSLKPFYLTSGFRNEHTDWMERHGVTILDTSNAVESRIAGLLESGKYPRDFLGHWLRSEICNIEKEDDYVLYTDCDIVFLKEPSLSDIKPAYMACSTEFQQDNWNYFNSGVMVMNITALRESYGSFLSYICEQIQACGPTYLDQSAYNEFYRSRWSRLAEVYNWKPYWPANSEAQILHFHGPKLMLVRHIAEVGLKADSPHLAIMVSLVGAFNGDYADAIMQALRAVGDGDFPERDWLVSLAAKLASGDLPIDANDIDLSFLEHRMFAQDLPGKPADKWRMRLDSALASFRKVPKIK